jgi:hypothetical protein
MSENSLSFTRYSGVTLEELRRPNSRHLSEYLSFYVMHLRAGTFFIPFFLSFLSRDFHPISLLNVLFEGLPRAVALNKRCWLIGCLSIGLFAVGVSLLRTDGGMPDTSALLTTHHHAYGEIWLETIMHHCTQGVVMGSQLRPIPLCCGPGILYN